MRCLAAAAASLSLAKEAEAAAAAAAAAEAAAKVAAAVVAVEILVPQVSAGVRPERRASVQERRQPAPLERFPCAWAQQLSMGAGATESPPPPRDEIRMHCR
eukprot:CAMPEP_0171862866 /NCGR_PEP_ID=MMETSP0992-20121227/27929_1 /TAXON_ID=483369 /ORGANISM="non described non described, Strain CCMP2098" /LENGTH=101 /DNA_ID=CAMNT_0012485153 /DNA_START=64 /DNA_END=369 /DNA_ORIENTATION=-